ncbi:MAG TPA: hypothetical protein VK141_11930 [Nitrosomonas sp.]|nr:hypothetical protein [Nitrosomonas sp.]
MSTVNDDSSSSNKHFTFTLDDNGDVIAFFEVENGVSTEESIGSDDIFEVDGTTITRVKSSSNDPVEIVYSDPEGDGTYVITSDSSNTGGDDNSGGGGKGYKFTIADGTITEVFEIKDGEEKPDPISDSETYALGDNNTVVRTDLSEIGSEITVYNDTDGDGIYHRFSEQWAPDTSGAGPFKIEDRLVYTGDDDSNKIAVRDGEDCHGGGGKDDFVLREAGNLRIADYSNSDDDLIVFDTGLGLTSKEEVQSYVTDLHYEGEDLVVVFGSAATVTLVGVPSDQISWDDVSVLS